MSQQTPNTESVELVDDTTVKNIARAALFAALTGAFAYVSFPYPLSPAPVTLQVLGVFLAGILLGPVWGGGALVLYLTAGAVGAPVFAGGEAGLGSLVGPTAGYLWSYPITAAIVGVLVHGRSVGPLETVGVPRLLAAMTLGVIVVYTFGVLGQMLVLDLALSTAIITGALVFLPAEALKMAAAVGIVRSNRLTAA